MAYDLLADDRSFLILGLKNDHFLTDVNLNSETNKKDGILQLFPDSSQEFYSIVNVLWNSARSLAYHYEALKVLENFTNEKESIYFFESVPETEKKKELH